MVIKGGATRGLRRSTLREGLRKSPGEVCTMNKDALERKSYLVAEKKNLNFVKNHMLSDILGGADLLTLPLSLHPHALIRNVSPVLPRGHQWERDPGRETKAYPAGAGFGTLVWWWPWLPRPLLSL